MPMPEKMKLYNQNPLGAVRASRDDESVLIEFLTPGFSKENIKVNISNDILTVSGSVESERQSKESGAYFVNELRGHNLDWFERRVSINTEHLQIDKAKSSFKDGILSVSIPFSELSKSNFDIPVE